MPKISYDFELAADLRLHDLFLPPMILQPFVENAVKHGLANKTGNGVVKLCFSQDKDVLFVTIEDNGIGRVAASQIASMKNRKGTSFSTEANKNRIELLNANFTTKITYEIFDLLNQEKNVLGTKVCLRIPQQKDL
jgi:LytS/YehU family sensor histidine kinase